MKVNCDKLYAWINELPRYFFPFDKESIPKNGIYFLFEKGEVYKQYDRVVRVGTHKGIDNLPKRLVEHFITPNKDRSIFRKNIGRAILNRDKNDFLRFWNIDLTSKENRKKYENTIDQEILKNTEEQVTGIIQANFSFVILELLDKEDRLYYEKKLISLFSLCPESLPSKNWLGNYSPQRKIRQSGLWQEQELWKAPLSDLEIENMIKSTAE
jgi:hypothetical protein